MALPRWFNLAIGLLAVVVGLLVYVSAPSFEHLSEVYRPHRPLLVTLINSLGWLIGGFPLPNEERAIARACKSANLPPDAECAVDQSTDDIEWRDGLRRLLESYASDANLSALGVLMASGQLETWLKVRIRLIHAWRALPAGALAAQRIARPILIVGLPRTGTTFLLNLLKQDPALRTPLHWELVEPLAGEGEGPLGEAHVERLQANLEQFMKLVPGMREWHPMGAAMAEECVVTLAHEFASMLFEATFDVSSYTEWLVRRSSERHAHAFRWHRKLLQFLQRREQLSATTARGAGGGVGDGDAGGGAMGGGGAPTRQWVLKTPWFSHGPVLEAAFREYPDALVIATHRAPHVVVGSSASVHARMYGAVSDQLDLRRIGAAQLELMEVLLESNLDTRARWEVEAPEITKRIADVTLAELKRAPLGVVRRIYKQLGFTLSDAAEAAMRAWLASGQVEHGKHHFELRHFGLAAEKLAERPVFRRYCERFALDDCVHRENATDVDL